MCEMFTHVFANRVPNRKQDALAFVVTRTIAVRLAEVAERDWSIDG